MLTLPRNQEGALRLGAEIGAVLDRLGATGRARYRAELVAEEILTNLVKYAEGAPGDQVEMHVVQAPTELRLEVVDRTRPYSPESSEPARLGENHVRDGGLGLALVRRSCDQLYYETDEDGANRLIAVFRRDSEKDFEPEDPPDIGDVEM